MPVFVEDHPSEALVLEGLDPRTLGLFHGIAMPDQSTLGPGPDVGVIHLFQRNLEREVEDDDELAEQIRITVLHETAHYFGAGEQDMHRFGLNRAAGAGARARRAAVRRGRRGRAAAARAS